MLKINAYQQQVNLPTRTDGPGTGVKRTNLPDSAASKVNFKSTLDTVLNDEKRVQFSAHARARLHSRGVELSEDKLTALSNAIDKAEAKGARESLVLSEDAAYVVSVPNRTVITAFDRDNLRDGVFTSIDSAVIL
ncbi:MAG: TIGR02530 family flagellar biosynthesis protein [Candidatus Zixiibacteriota bacterium]